MSLAIDRDELKASLARIATPKAMVTKVWDEQQEKFGKSAVKVVCVDSDKLDTLRYSDAWVGNDDDVQVGETHHVRIDSIKNVTSIPDAKIVIIEKVLQIHCESAEELSAWVTGLSVLKKVCEIEAGTDEEQPHELNCTTNEKPAQVEEMKTMTTNNNTSSATQTKFSTKNMQELFDLMTEKDMKIEELEQQLEATDQLCEDRNQTIVTLSKRLEHSLRMLKAVHSMYEQQQRVLSAQDSVIKEMDGANQAIQSAAGQMKSLLTYSKTPTHAGASAMNRTSVTPTHISNAAAHMLKQQQASSTRSAPTTPGLQRKMQSSSNSGLPYASRAAFLAAKANAEADLSKPERTPTNQSFKPQTRTPNAGMTSAQDFLAAELAKLKGMTNNIRLNSTGEGNTEDFDMNSILSQKTPNSKVPSSAVPVATKPSLSDDDSAPATVKDVEQVESLMRKIQDMRSMMEQMTSSMPKMEPEDKSDVSELVAANQLPLKPNEMDSATEELLSKLTGDTMLSKDGKLGEYMNNLTQLESEKKSMESQLADAQKQQNDMLQRLEEMKNMANMFRNIGIKQ